MQRAVIWAFALAAVIPSRVQASPNIALDDPVHEYLLTLRAQGTLVPYSGGLQIISEQRARTLLAMAGVADDFPALMAAPNGFWLEPLREAMTRASAYHDRIRPYSTTVRPRDIVGGVAVSCERQHGGPCGEGVGATTELESSAGFSSFASGLVRIRATSGTGTHDTRLEFEHAYLELELDPVRLQIGRDLLVLGPSAEAHVAWSDHAGPLDQVRVSTRPINLVGDHGATLRGSIVYVLGRLRAPQTFPGTLVSIARGQLDIENRLELGMMQLLQLGGDGARELDAWNFITEHVRRGDASATATDSSNRRIGFDFCTQISGLWRSRLYYQIVFEDWRKRFHDAIRFEGDHVFGWDLPALTGGRRLTVEVEKTGARSQEHVPRVTGFTNRSRGIGSALGPDTWSLLVRSRLPTTIGDLLPWLQFTRHSSDKYTFEEFGPIIRVERGVAEYRVRGGLSIRMPIGATMRLQLEARGEFIQNFGFVSGEREISIGGEASLTWFPSYRIGGRL